MPVRYPHLPSSTTRRELRSHDRQTVGLRTNSAIVVTFTAIHALDININASAFFRRWPAAPVSFHAD
jgi:hypothetical protein